MKSLMLAPLVSLLLLLIAPLRAHADTLVVLNKAEATASLLEPTTGKVMATLPTGPGPHEVGLSPNGRTAVVTDYGTRNAPGRTLTVLDIVKARRTQTIDLGPHRRPHGIVWIPGSQRVVVTVEASKAIIVVDVPSGKILTTIPTDQEISHMVALSQDGKQAFVTSIGSGTLTVIDVDRAKRIRTVVTGKGAEGIDITADGREVWVTNREADTVSVVNTRTLKIERTLKSPSFPIRARATPDGKWMLMSNARSADLFVFDAKRRTKAHVLSLKGTARDTTDRAFADQFGKSPVPIGVVTNPAATKAYVALANADAIAVIDLARFAIIGELRAGKEPDGMAYSTTSVAQ